MNVVGIRGHLKVTKWPFSGEILFSPARSASMSRNKRLDGSITPSLAPYGRLFPAISRSAALTAGEWDEHLNMCRISCHHRPEVMNWVPDRDGRHHWEWQERVRRGWRSVGVGLVGFTVSQGLWLYSQGIGDIILLLYAVCCKVGADLSGLSCPARQKR